MEPDQHGMAHGDQLGRPLGRLDTGDPGRRQHVALGDGVIGHLGGRLGQHRNPASGQGPAMCWFPRGDVDHAGSAQRVEIGQHAVGHEEAVYDLAGRLPDVGSRARTGRLGSLRKRVPREPRRRIPLPTYEYACTACGHQLEAVQSFSDDPLTDVPRVWGVVAQGLWQCRHRLQGQWLLQDRFRAHGNGKSASSDSSGSDTTTKTDSSTTADSGSELDSVPRAQSPVPR